MIDFASAPAQNLDTMAMWLGTGAVAAVPAAIAIAVRFNRPRPFQAIGGQPRHDRKDCQTSGATGCPRSPKDASGPTSPAAVLGYLTRSAALPLDPGASLAERLFFGVAKPSRPARDRAIFLLGQAILRYFPDPSWLAVRTTRPRRCNRFSRSSCTPP